MPARATRKHKLGRADGITVRGVFHMALFLKTAAFPHLPKEVCKNVLKGCFAACCHCVARAQEIAGDWGCCKLGWNVCASI